MKRFKFIIPLFLLVACGEPCSLKLTEAEELMIPADFQSVNSSFQETVQSSESPTVIKYIDAMCSYCLMELKQWKELKAEEVDMNLIFVASGTTLKDVEYAFYKADFEALYYHDSLYSFMDSNAIPANKNLQTLVLNPSGSIIYRGNPFVDEETTRCFKRLIEK